MAIKLIPLLSNCNDLIELFLIKCIFNTYVEIHPNRKMEKENELLVTEFINFHNKITNRVDKTINWIAGISILGLIPLIYYFIVKYWQSLDLEPHLAALQIVIPFIVIVLFLLFNYKSTWEDLLESIKSNVVQQYFHWNQINYSKIMKVIKNKKS